jgi:hypothetical protein
MRMSLKVDKTFGSRKAEVLSYLRSRAAECLGEVTQQFGVRQFKKRAAAINRALAREKDDLASMVGQVAERENWGPQATLQAVLLLMHCTNVVMLETRNDVWPYEYMAFSRRIGELWEPFITTCFHYPVRKDVALFIPPLFRDIRERLTQEVRAFIENLNIGDADKQSLLRYYDQVWQLVTSGEIKLELDLHFCIADKRYVVDCKSSFGSNEKGNTNRLLLVASVYRNIEPEDYACLILVRSSEDENNHYLQTLKRSGLWEVYCGAETYPKVLAFCGFDLGAWIKANVTWLADLDSAFVGHLKKNDLVKYLTW